LQDFQHIFDTLHDHPARLRELIPTDPNFIGACDALGCLGTGGVWFPKTGPPPPFVAACFPSHHHLITQLAGHLVTNSDLVELAATIKHQDIVGTTYSTAELTTSSGSDNIAAVAWQHKGPSTTFAPACAYLLHLAASFHRCHHRYFQSIHYIPVTYNTMADMASQALVHYTFCIKVSENAL
jgi:hypothetical protein